MGLYNTTLLQYNADRSLGGIKGILVESSATYVLLIHSLSTGLKVGQVQAIFQAIALGDQPQLPTPHLTYIQFL
jgi:hypothetical protein